MITKAKYLYEYLIEVTFDDGIIKVIDLESFFKNHNWALVRKFIPLELFKQFYIDCGTLMWGDNECSIDQFEIYEGKYDAVVEYA